MKADVKWESIESQLGDWACKFKPFHDAGGFNEIFTFLKSQTADKNNRKIICPHHTDLFRAFRETPYKDLRCIFILQDPYPWIKDKKYVADGLAMSCSHTGVCQPSLDYFYDGMADDLGVKVPHHPDLSYLARQGILFLNTSLTVELNKPTSHKGIWDSFMKYLVEEVINFYSYGLIYVSFGQNAQLLSKAMMPFLHWGFNVEHPAAAARQERLWKHERIFSKINRILKDTNNETIKWVYGTDETFMGAGGGKMAEPKSTGVSGRKRSDVFD